MDQSRINLAEHGTAILCEECSIGTFENIVYLYRISKLVTGSQQDTVVPMPSFKCSKCGHINKEFSIKSKDKPQLIK